MVNLNSLSRLEGEMLSPFHGERSDGTGRHVDSQILKVGNSQAPGLSKNPRAGQTVGHVWKPRRHQNCQVGYCQAHQVTVGGRPHVPGGEDHKDHHDVANDSHSTHQ